MIVAPDSRTARVGAGVRWQALLDAAAPHGLAGLTGTCMSVGVVGYTLGGGFGWLGRRYGFGADHVRSAEIVTADGRALTASTTENADLFDALLGTGGMFGVVTSLDVELFPVTDVYGGGVGFPIERSRDVTVAYREWNAALPPEVTSSLVFLRMPPLPSVPEPLRGREVVAVMACVDGNQRRGEHLLAPIRSVPGAILDTFTTMPFTRAGEIMPAPADPMPSTGFGEGLRALTDATIDDLLALVGPGSGCPCNLVEIRYLGGPRPAGARPGFAYYDGDYIMHTLAIAPSPDAMRGAQAYHARLAATMRPHTTGGMPLTFAGDANDTRGVLRAALHPERYRRLAAAKRAHDPADRFRFTYPL